jgi:serine acetyltransferase
MPAHGSIGAGCRLAGRIMIHSGGGVTGSVVSSDVPDYAVAAGNPARIVKERARVRFTYEPMRASRSPVFK